MASQGSVVSLILQTVIIAVLLYGCFKIVGYILYVRKIKRIFKDAPGPTEKHWLFGSLAKFPTNMHDRMMHFVTLCNKYGDHGYMVIWGPFWIPIVVACSPHVMGQICKSSEPKSVNLVGIYRMIRPWLGDGLLVANGDRWARNRRLLTPAFHFDILKPYLQVYSSAADKFVAKIENFSDQGTQFEAFGNVCLCTLEIILKCAFSYSKDIQNDPDSNEYVQAVRRLSDGLTYRFLHPHLFLDIFWKLSSVGRAFKKDCDYVHSVAEEVIEKRRQTLEAGAGTRDSKYKDFLDILLTARDENNVGLSQLEIRNEVDTFLFEGHDTTASAISWIMYALAKHPEYQQKCQKEIDGVLAGRDSDELLWSDLQNLEYLTMCIKEGMRLYSPVPVLSRETQKPFDVGDQVFPPGILIQLNIWALNHMENLWGSDHMEFIPERFSKDNVAKMKPFQYVPFSAGSRNCIGQNFAMNEEKVVLSKLLRNFTFTLAPGQEDIRVHPSAVMRSEKGIFLLAEKRSVS